MPANGSTRSAARQSENSDDVAQEQVGRKRRVALQEVDVNRRSRRNSRGTEEKGVSANYNETKKNGEKSDRQLRSQKREQVKQHSTKQASSSCSFQIYQDPVPAEDASGSHPKSSDTSKRRKVGHLQAAQSVENSEPKTSKQPQAPAHNAEHSGDGGWEVLEVVSTKKASESVDAHAAESNCANPSNVQDKAALDDLSPVEDGQSSLNDMKVAEEEKCHEDDRTIEEREVLSTAEHKSTDSISVETALLQSDIGREMLEGEDAVALVENNFRVLAARSWVLPSHPDVYDIDMPHQLDEFYVTEYANEIYDFLRRDETRSMVDADYMSRQTDINGKMRVILNDWLVEVHLKFKLRQETLYLCFQLIDRFLENTNVPRQRLQLVGVTGLMLASKYEEIYPPEVRDYVYICDNAYTREEILQMEQTMLATLEYRLSLPTVWCFMKRYCKAAGRQVDKPDDFFHIMSYLIELSMIQVRMLRFAPSIMVAASIFLTNTLRNEPEAWTDQLQHHTGYTPVELEECVGEMRSLVADAPKEQRYKAVYKKFCHRQFESVALLPDLQPTDSAAGEPADSAATAL